MSDWINIEPTELFGPGQARLVNLGDVQIAVFNIDGEFHAIENNCSHDNSQMLSSDLELEQLLDGEQIICPRHGARFCIKTGKALTPPAYEDVPVFPVQITDGIVQTRDNRWD